MPRKNRRKRRRSAAGTGLGRGHGSNSQLADIVKRPLSAVERKAKLAGQIEQNVKGYSMGTCRISVGSSSLGYHLSIAHSKRYPTWDECAKARYKLLPDDVTMGMLFPPGADYINVHNYCFHLWEVTGLADARKLETIGTTMARTLYEIQAGGDAASIIDRFGEELERWLEAE